MSRLVFASLGLVLSLSVVVFLASVIQLARMRREDRSLDRPSIAGQGRQRPRRSGLSILLRRLRTLGQTATRDATSMRSYLRP